MGGQKFQYDESGGTFVYFLLSFLALILVPSTYYSLSKKKKEGKIHFTYQPFMSCFTVFSTVSLTGKSMNPEQYLNLKFWLICINFLSEKNENVCSCENCLIKKIRLERKDPSDTLKKFLVWVWSWLFFRFFLKLFYLFWCRRLSIFLGWILFFYVAYKTTQYDYEFANFDPYEILQVEVGASPAAIKSAYRKLSLIHHPDKESGDETAFMRLSKAYQVRCFCCQLVIG